MLEVQNLSTQFRTERGLVTVVRDLSFSLSKGEMLCIVGESGSGKSITALSIMQLLAKNAVVTEGKILFNAVDLLTYSKKEINRLRGDVLSMIFQEPMTSLNPVLTIGFQLCEPLRIHKGLSKKEAHSRALALLDIVGIEGSLKRMKQYPHELSGGMRQRVMIAMALACEPELLIADEPTTALDVTIQAQILELINHLQKKLNMGVILITHDMGVVAEVADRVIVMYAGEIVEMGTKAEIFLQRKHPYTDALLTLMPNIDTDNYVLEAIPGSLPDPHEEIKGCRFYDRCRYACSKCKEEKVALRQHSDTHFSRCLLVNDLT